MTGIRCLAFVWGSRAAGTSKTDNGDTSSMPKWYVTTIIYFYMTSPSVTLWKTVQHRQDYLSRWLIKFRTQYNTQACMFRSASLFIGTSFTVAVFTIFATSNVDSIVGIPHKIFNAKIFNPHKKPISLLNVLICTQGMQRTWWPEAGTIIVSGPYW